MEDLLKKQKRNRLHYINNKERYRKNHRKWWKKTMSKWLPYLSENPKCEICSRKLKYFSGNCDNSVHFDHKENNVIKYSPSDWLRNNKPSIKNIKIWNACNFGILCSKCNRGLPTKNRKIWIKQATTYINSG